VGILGVALAATGAVGCGSSQPKFGIVRTGDLPAGQTWSGVYYNEVYGYLHLVEQDGNVTGRWKRKDGSEWGELGGTVQGNVLNFSWKEHKYGAVGPSADSKGSGVFRYRMGESNIPALDGQYALSESSSVGEWNCIKQQGMKPDLNSINGQGVDNMGVSPEGWK
jgi:hypothetical protein